MRFQSTVLAIAASLALANAQADLSSVPQCAVQCLMAAVPDSGCGLTDTKCQCTTGQDKITKSVTECAPKRCSAEDVAKLAPALAGLCADAGVSLSNVPTAAMSSGAGSATGSAASGSAMTSMMASGSPTSGMESATGSELPVQTANAAAGSAVGYGAVALGMAAVFGL